MLAAPGRTWVGQTRLRTSNLLAMVSDLWGRLKGFGTGTVPEVIMRQPERHGPDVRGPCGSCPLVFQGGYNVNYIRFRILFLLYPRIPILLLAFVGGKELMNDVGGILGDSEASREDYEKCLDHMPGVGPLDPFETLECKGSVERGLQ